MMMSFKCFSCLVEFGSGVILAQKTFGSIRRNFAKDSIFHWKIFSNHDDEMNRNRSSVNNQTEPQWKSQGKKSINQSKSNVSWITWTDKKWKIFCTVNMFSMIDISVWFLGTIFEIGEQYVLYYATTNVNCNWIDTVIDWLTTNETTR